MTHPSVNSIVERLFEKFGDDPLISEAADSLIGWSSANAKLKARALAAESSLSRIKEETIEACAKVAEGLADQQRATNEAYPDHVKAYPVWRNYVFTFESVASALRSLGSTDTGAGAKAHE